MSGLVVDLFAGAGGTSTGVEAALHRPVDYAINHSATALAVHKANHPRTVHLTANVWDVPPRSVVGRRRVRLLVASPDCKHFSRSKGGKPRDRNIRSLAWVVRDWARDVRPEVIVVENVPEFEKWGPLYEPGHVMPNGRVLKAGDKLIDRPIPDRAGETFAQWHGALELLGYQVEMRVLRACDYGAPTSRKRLFVIARCDGEPIRWPDPTHGPGLLPFHTAGECIDFSLPMRSIFGRKKPLAEATLRRIAAGLRKFVFEHPAPFIVGETAPILIQTGQGERRGQRPRYLDLQKPLGTVVAGGVKHALVTAFLAKHYGGKSTPGSSLERPMDTITAQDHHALVTAELDGSPDRREQVRAYLTAYYSSGSQAGQDLREPLRTIVGVDRFGLVSIHGQEHVVTDIRMRMLTAPELLRAQFGRFAADYDLSAAETNKDQVLLIGNSVCPELAEALITANVPRERQRRAA